MCPNVGHGAQLTDGDWVLPLFSGEAVKRQILKSVLSSQLLITTELLVPESLCKAAKRTLYDYNGLLGLGPCSAPK